LERITGGYRGTTVHVKQLDCWKFEADLNSFGILGKIFKINYEYSPKIIANKQKHYTAYHHKISYQTAD
jgi:hypothetical protein